MAAIATSRTQAAFFPAAPPPLGSLISILFPTILLKAASSSFSMVSLSFTPAGDPSRFDVISRLSSGFLANKIEAVAGEVMISAGLEEEREAPRKEADMEHEQRWAEEEEACGEEAEAA